MDNELFAIEFRKTLPIGTKITFTKTLESSPCGDFPAYRYASKHQKGEVVGHGCPEGYWVKTESCDDKFGAILGVEFMEDTQ